MDSAVDSDKWLDEANDNARKQAWYMKRAFDQGNIREALQCASAMTGELRTSKISPKNYYELYMNVTDELREMEQYFTEEDLKEQKGQGGRSVVELYENVQHAGNIIPRLYLLITVASVYIRSKKAPAKDILFDLVELCRGVQHPTRGLFLRNYLSQISKDKLPDTGSEYEGAGGTVTDAIEFVLQNFAEMNKLWVRMQHQGAVKDRVKREQERQNLRQLVGTNLVRLSEMNGVDLAMYKELVLPRILEQIVNCKDVIAQEYLMEVVIQIFPDEFHLQSLETFLGTCAHLQEGVKVQDILSSLMQRLANFASQQPDSIPSGLEMFPLFHSNISQIIQSSGKMALVDVLALQVALVNFASKVYPDRIEYIDNALGLSVQVLEKFGKDMVDSKCVKTIIELLSLPLDSLSLRILNLVSYEPLMAYLADYYKKQVATTIVKAVLKSKTKLDSVEKVDTLFKYVSTLIKGQGEEETKVADEDRYEFDQEQHLMAQIFHLIQHEDTDVQFQLYQSTRKHFGQGGTQRIEYTLPPLLFGVLKLLERVQVREKEGDETLQVKSKKIFGFVHETISVLSPHYPELALRLFLQAAQTADQGGYEAIAYEFVAQAFICYEDEIADSKAQYTAINYIVALLPRFKVFDKDNCDTLVSKATQHCAKLLKKTDQCRAVYNCAHLFWPHDDDAASENMRDEKRALQCLQRALKIANACIGHQVHLFVEILNKYLYFFDRKCPSITTKYLKGLIDLIDEQMPSLDASETSKVAKAHYWNTIKHIKLKAALDDEIGALYRSIPLNSVEP